VFRGGHQFDIPLGPSGIVMPREKPRAISRFIVMAILQAARAERMGLPRDSAYSWGLNRAIFIAAAKQGFRGGGAAGGSGRSSDSGMHPGPSKDTYMLGRELAYRDPSQEKLYFTIGGDVQTEKDFEKQIIERFGSAANFERAWSEAREIVAKADPESLESAGEFYSQVYKPRRDELRAKWTEMIGGPPVKLAGS
jgi:hypothetical protein